MPHPTIQLPCPACNESLTVSPELQNFACAACGQSLQVNREGGIVALVKMAVADDLRGRLEALLREPMVDGEPGYMVLRIEFQRLGKLHPWNVFVASRDILENIFRKLSLKELDRVIDTYAMNPDGPMYTWLMKVRETRIALAEKEKKPF